MQLLDALTRRRVKHHGDLDLLTLKVVYESHVPWATSTQMGKYVLTTSYYSVVIYGNHGPMS